MICGSLFSPSAMSLGVVLANSATATVVIGVGEFRLLVITREPVTVITWSPSSEASVVAGAASSA
jgi:hypothetical protein